MHDPLFSSNDPSVHPEGSLEERERRRAERINETGKHLAEVVCVQEPNLADLKAGMELRGAPSLGMRENSNVSIVLACVDQLEETLEHTIDLQLKIATATARMEDLSKDVSACLEKVQEFHRDINSSLIALQENVQCLDLKVTDVRQYADACVGNIGSQVDLCSEMMGLKDADQANNIARLDQGLSKLSSHLNAAVSELGCRISAQEKWLCTVAKAIPQREMAGTLDDESKHMPKCESWMNHKPMRHFSGSSFSDALSDVLSIAPQPSGESPKSNSPLGDSRNIGSRHFTTPSPTRKTSVHACRIGGRSCYDQDRSLERLPDDGSFPEHDELETVYVHYGGKAGYHSKASNADEGKGEVRRKIWPKP